MKKIQMGSPRASDKGKIDDSGFIIIQQPNDYHAARSGYGIAGTSGIHMPVDDPCEESAELSSRRVLRPIMTLPPNDGMARPAGGAQKSREDITNDRLLARLRRGGGI